MEALVKEILSGAAGDPRSVFKEKLTAAAAVPGQQAELVAALLGGGLEQQPISAVQCLAACVVAAQGPLRGELQKPEVLARALLAAGAKASAVADTALMVLGSASPQSQSAAAPPGELWHALARAQGLRSWEELPPSNARAAAVRLWTRKAEFGPPGATAAALARWLAQPAAMEAERGPLVAKVRGLWSQQAVSLDLQVQDALSALLHDAPDATALDQQRPSAEWLTTVLMPCTHGREEWGGSPWMCSLFAGASTAGAVAAASGLMKRPGGRAAVLFAWIALYRSLLSGLVGPAPSDFETSGLAVLALLREVTEIWFAESAWQEVAAALFSMVLTWPRNLEAAPREARGLVLLPAWLDFARSLLLELPGRLGLQHGEPLAAALPLVLATLPAGLELEQLSGPGPRKLALELRAWAWASATPPLPRCVAGCAGKGRAGAASGAGLQNLGNTCYLNALLQALALTDGLVAAVLRLFPPHVCLAPLSGPEQEQGQGQGQGRESPQVGDAARAQSQLPARGGQVRRALAQVLTRLAVARKPFSPGALASLTPFGLQGHQQDVTELARWLFEQLGDPEHEDSPLGGSFGGSARTVVRCSNCQHVQEKTEAFSDLALSVILSQTQTTPSADGALGTTNSDGCQSSSLDALLRAHLSEESLPGYCCDACGSRGTSSRRYEITKPPRNLVLTLNRFSYSAQGGQEKLAARVGLQKQLDLPLASGTSSGSESTRNSVTYNLYAFVTHAGSTPHSGHYVCIGRGSHNAEDTAWMRFDDASVSQLPGDVTADVLDTYANGTATAYMLFYTWEPKATPPAAALHLPARFYVETVLGELADFIGGSSTPSQLGIAPRPGPPQDPPPGLDGGGGFGGVGGSGWVC